MPRNAGATAAGVARGTGRGGCAARWARRAPPAGVSRAAAAVAGPAFLRIESSVESIINLNKVSEFFREHAGCAGVVVLAHSVPLPVQRRRCRALKVQLNP